MKKLFNLLCVFGILSLFLAVPAIAQGETPYVIRSTRPISTDLRVALDAWLAVSPPSNATYYIVTYAKMRGDDWLVSLAGVDLEAPDADWTLEDGFVWLGSVRVNQAWEVEPLNPTGTGKGGGMLRARLGAGAGGGSHIAFPFRNSAMYGFLGVGTDVLYPYAPDLLFLSFVGSDEWGVASMPPSAYASADGEVVFVCEDANSTAVKTYNDTTQDTFFYGHLVDNETLTLEHEFQQGDFIASLEYGEYYSTCGIQTLGRKAYSLRWGFEPKEEGSILVWSYQVGSCILASGTLTSSAAVWRCGNQIIHPGGFIAAGGGYSDTGETDGTSGAGATVVSDPTFWDYVLGGIIALVNLLFVNVLPEHGSSQFIYVFFNTIEMLFRLARILVFQSINIYPIIYALGIVIAFKLLFSLVYVALILVRAWKQLVPVAGA